MSVITYGPQGCGKTRNAQALAKHFGLNHIIDDGEDECGNSWHPGDPVPDDTLALISAPLIPGALSFNDAMAAMASASALE